MILYHGSNLAVQKPMLMPRVRALDFGQAFYCKGAYTEEEALRRLLPQRLRDQFAFKTETALAGLSFREAMSVFCL